MFSIPGYEATGASNEKPATCVPDTAPIVTTTTCDREIAPPQRHRAVVTDVHIDVEQAPSATADVAVKSKLPKLKPLTVTDSAPLAAMFMPAYDTTGPSNVNDGSAVPATAPTVTCTTDACESNPDARHPADVAEVHAAVLQAACAKVSVAVKL
jgi:hypothetical protein